MRWHDRTRWTVVVSVLVGLTRHFYSILLPFVQRIRVGKVVVYILPRQISIVAYMAGLVVYRADLVRCTQLNRQAISGPQVKDS
ncbi:hypothetical protein F5Y15DRAFT_364607 [Xylariaceae sp. FL0016]|nr:hypothetical protein F5Y15DRAFT_364607 [Xylariaceae sp. FL0016]